VGRAPCLRRLGWYDVRSEGDHVQMAHADKPGYRVTVDRNRHKIIPPKTLQSILTQAGMTVDDLREEL
jgi:predicted RNA binding protein YcfA (HicA-like mRNA interferase family)